MISIYLYYFPLQSEYQKSIFFKKKVLINNYEVKYLMTLIIEHSLNQIVGTNWILIELISLWQIVIN